MKTINAALAVVMLGLASSTPGRACDFGVWDAKTGEMLPLPTVEEAMPVSDVVFVGTVKGFRIDTTELLALTPWDTAECTDDPSAAQCRVRLETVISVVYEVEDTVKGVEAGRLYEEPFAVNDGCGPAPEFGKRYVRAEGPFGLRELPEKPTAEQLERWRSIAMPKS